jgi:rRNA-processing protein FCF1
LIIYKSKGIIMEILFTIVLLYIAAQTTYLTVRSYKKAPLGRSRLQPIFVDTSVLIDGRIIALANSGFITSTLSIPRSVIGELQFLADHGDTEKRTRARHGLDVVSELQAMKHVKVEIFPDSPRAEEGVDNRLLMLSKKYKGVLCTIDFNLNKVAQVEGLQVLNVNDLAKSLRMAYLPGERLMLELTTKGSDSHQAVGHLTDGTMVVVEHANAHIGSIREVEFIRSLQTAAGKMLFARLADQPKPKQTPVKAVKGRKPIAAPIQQSAAEPAVTTLPTADTRDTRNKQQRAPQAVKQPQQQQKQPQQPRQQDRPKQQQNNQQQKRTNRRPKTNEDRLVELANS